MAHPEFGFILLLAIAVVFGLMFPWARASNYDIDKIKIGDTKDQVAAAFGEPKSVTSRGAGGPEEWIYTIPFRIFVSIVFDGDGRVRSRYRSGEV